MSNTHNLLSQLLPQASGQIDFSALDYSHLSQDFEKMAVALGGVQRVELGKMTMLPADVIEFLLDDRGGFCKLTSHVESRQEIYHDFEQRLANIMKVPAHILKASATSTSHLALALCW